MQGFEVKYAGCCAIAELHNISRLSGPEEVVDATIKAIWAKTDGFYSFKPYIFFTGVVGTRQKRFEPFYHADTTQDYGQALADYIKAASLGEIFDEIPVKQNWSGNMVKVWFWMPDYAILAKRYEEKLAPKPPEVVIPPSPVIEAPSINGLEA